MALQRTTKAVVENAVSKREPFKRGNVWGKWQEKGYYHPAMQLAWMNGLYANLLGEHSQNERLYVVYSYDTPMAWYVGSEGKWYYPNENHSVSTTQHQHAYQMALRGETVVVLTYDENDNLVKTEKEYFSNLYTS